MFHETIEEIMPNRHGNDVECAAYYELSGEMAAFAIAHEVVCAKTDILESISSTLEMPPLTTQEVLEKYLENKNEVDNILHDHFNGVSGFDNPLDAIVDGVRALLEKEILDTVEWSINRLRDEIHPATGLRTGELVELSYDEWNKIGLHYFDLNYGYITDQVNITRNKVANLYR